MALMPFQPFLKLAIKNQIAQPLAIDNVLQRLRHPHAEAAGCSKRILAVMHQDSVHWHAYCVGRSILQRWFRNVI